MLKKALGGILTAQEAEELYSAFDQIGNIIVIRIPESLLSKKKVIGETLLQKVNHIRSVFCQVSD
ncbi:MAG: class I SAM-dependent methyltransferase family protein, partial [Candidatus Nitrosotenuis sp.]